MLTRSIPASPSLAVTLVAVLLTCLPARAQKAPASKRVRVSRVRLEAHVRALASPAFGGRPNGAGGAKARGYLIDAFGALGLRPGAGQGYVQPFGRVIRGQNVLAMLPGSDPARADEVIVLAAHYDHLGRRGGQLHPGANDNAAGVAVLLELARVLSARRPARSVLFASWDAEEDGLVGSRYWTAHPTIPLKRVVAYMDWDLIGRDLLDIFPRKLFAVGGESCARLTALVDRLAPGRDLLELVPVGADLVGPRCDFWNFRAKRIPALFFSCGEHHDYHSPNDTPDLIRYDKLTQIGQLIAAVARGAADGAARPVWRRPSYHPREAAALAGIVGAIPLRAKLRPFERRLLVAGAASLNRLANKRRRTWADRRVMQAAVYAALLRGRIRAFEPIDPQGAEPKGRR